jgi:UDP-N-acetylglucosamine 2-epimerase (non-hydrolysing)
MKQQLTIVIGTRPEAIKLAPVVIEARRRSDVFDVTIVRTSQHREMLDQVLADFDLVADVDLDIMRPDQDLVHVTTEGLRRLSDSFAAIKPDWVIVQGDTTTTFVAGLAAFYQQRRVAHVEAGLRTYDTYQPFPEEINRCMTTRLADLHLAPTASARDNLLREAIDPKRIVVTGNTAIDALLYTVERAGERAVVRDPQRPLLLLTAHRRENHGQPMQRICDAVLTLLARYPTLEVRYPVHLSPRVRETVFPRLSGHPRVTLCEPLDYKAFVLAMHEARVILTDSGGIQEEAPSLGRPVLVLRDTTERPEAVQVGAARLVGTSSERIVAEVSRLLDDDAHYAAMTCAVNPYGDGRAASRILDAIADYAPAEPACVS